VDSVYNSESNGQRSTKSWLFLAISVLLVISLIGCIAQSAAPVVNDTAKNHTGNGTQVPANNFSAGVIADNKTGVDKVQTAIALAVADGTYSQNVTYAYHSGTEIVNMTIAVKDDVITAVSITGTPSNPISARFINGVNAALPELVVGKKINALDIPRQVAGSSLTTAAFKQYVADVIETH